MKSILFYHDVSKESVFIQLSPILYPKILIVNVKKLSIRLLPSLSKVVNRVIFYYRFTIKILLKTYRKGSY